ncbi:MAG: RNA polymerase-associated protein RapA [Gammaproteobacteria bacterium]
MNDFIPGQRWISATEPELGLGIILDTDVQRVTVMYIAAGAKRIYARRNAPLTRVRFAPGDTIETADETKLTVRCVSEKNGLLSYAGSSQDGNEIQVEEIDLSHYIQFNRPQIRLFNGQIDPGAWFNLRYETWQALKRLQQSPVRGLIGGRTALLAHQIYIAHEAANRHSLRIMLADEVGLGKTIEAGLILHHRLLSGLARRALIIVPETLQYQWLVEMLRRFNLRFSIFEEGRCLETHEDNPFASEQLILCGLQFFSRYPERQKQALQCEWDLVVIDEAHHIEWDEHAPSTEYRFVEQLAALSPGLLLLTATPEQLGKKSHFARLRLLDPDRFYSFEKFLEEEKSFAPVAHAARLLLEEQALDASLQRELKSLLQDDKVETLLEKLNHPAEFRKAADALIAVLLDHHGTGRILFRNSRRTVKGFAERERYAYPLPAGSAESETLPQGPRFDWLAKKLKELGKQKALLICAQADTAVTLEKTLKSQAGIAAAVFHEGMTIVERDRAAAYFADPESNARVLICSEIGSEGRNFQFVMHLILFDLPHNPDLLEQRIGRLDRIGQRHVIRIHIPYCIGTEQHGLFRWYDEGLNAFRHNCSAATQVYAQQCERLHALLAQPQSPAFDAFLAESRQLAERLEAELLAGRDQLLELNSCRPHEAQRLITQLHDFERQHTLWPYMERLFDCYGVNSEFHSEDCYILEPGNHMRIAHFPELSEDGATVTVNRDIALLREDMRFLTWEHPMVVAAMDLVLSSETGNAAISFVKHPQASAGQFLLEILFIVECSAAPYLQIGRFMPPTPIRIVIDTALRDLSAKIAHETLIETPQNIDTLQLMTFINSRQKHINQMLAGAEKRAGETLQALIREASSVLLDTLGTEVKRLARLKKLNPSIRAEEIEHLKEIAQEAHFSIQAAQLKLDAVRVLITC